MNETVAKALVKYINAEQNDWNEATTKYTPFYLYNVDEKQSFLYRNVICLYLEGLGATRSEFGIVRTALKTLA